ncbi:MAG: response regulator [Proteobacteria bacterium]|nr:response regulator [Pseudomonadota bacterium]MBU1454115.1 response regulator [Pseudomonadota bacterium]
MTSQSLKKKITVVLSLVALAGFVVVAFLGGLDEYRETKDEYTVVMVSRIKVAKALVGRTIYQTDELVRRIIRRAEFSSVETVLAELSSSAYSDFFADSFYLLDPKGTVLQISEPYGYYKGLDFSGMITDAGESNEHVLLHQSLLNKQSMVTLRYPLANGNLLVVERSLANLIPVMAIFEAGSLYPGELFFVLNRSGQTVYHPNYGLVKSRHNLGFDLKERSKPDEEGLFSFSYQGKKYISFSETFQEPAEWSIYYSIPQAELYAKIQRAILQHLAFLSLFFGLLLLVMISVVNQFFSRPVRQLVTALENSSPGKALPLSQSMTAGIQELETIMEAISSRDLLVSQDGERLQAVLDGLDSLVYVSDMDTCEILFGNSVCRELFGDVVGKICYTVLQKGQKEPCPFCTNHLLLDEQGHPAGVQVWEFQNTLNGEWYGIRDQAIRWVDGRIVRMEIATNITEQKKASAALLDEKERLAVTLRSISEGVITTDMEGNVELVNRAAEELLGCSQKAAAGRSVEEVLSFLDEDSKAIKEHPVRKILRDGGILRIHKNRTRFLGKDELRTIAHSGAPIFDQTSQVVGTVLVFRDVSTDEKQEQELLKVRKLESVGVLAGGIAHDFNNILVAILGNLSLAGQFLDPLHKAFPLVLEAEKASLRARGLTQQLLTFSKGGEPVRQATSLGKLIRESAGFVLSGSNVVCNYQIDNDLWQVEIDSGQISQVIQNLIINAKQAMSMGGSVTLACRNVDKNDPSLSPLLKKQSYVQIEIRDNGIGMPLDVLERIFDPYFTTKEHGSGLGLAICHSILAKHDGLIAAESIIDEGSIFTFYLPAIVEEDGIGIVDEQDSCRGSGRVLVMDDEETVREIVKQVLEYLGYEVFQAIDGEEAIRIYRDQQKQARPIDAVIMDLTIPGGMGGQETVGEILKIDAAAKVLVSSGYSNDPIMANYSRYGFVGSVVKPFSLNELGQILYEVIGRK